MKKVNKRGLTKIRKKEGFGINPAKTSADRFI
jgi:hypothetical protein